MSENLTKAQLRNIVLKRLEKNTKQQRERKSRLIEKKLLKQEEFTKSKRIMFYLAFDGEVKTENMIDKARGLGKEIYVPLCDTERKTLIPCLLEKDSMLEAGPYNTLEPKKKMKFSSKKLDLVVVPALAFDEKGNRLGRGRGYYDRFLKHISSRTNSIGLAFDFQILPSIPVDSGDLPVDKVLFA
ncbi:MAG: 5-formyltetrahydrofolate cyclo-ligase [Candidatus Omnitrophica bacterium]|nr:5-formyltetrahydrofolate cyclo-ligase [Candidatus Omnitrophota bacterium]MBU1871490.1 5-formyltetrahydrofolate cyclo-ligase [Candidatus Omnitrophota bacterium]